MGMGGQFLPISMCFSDRKDSFLTFVICLLLGMTNVEQHIVPQCLSLGLPELRVLMVVDTYDVRHKTSSVLRQMTLSSKLSSVEFGRDED